jgi:single-strand DNA-binding protein
MLFGQNYSNLQRKGKAMNNVSMVGRLTADPESKALNSGKSLASFSIAVRRPFKNQDGEYESDFFDVRAFGRTAEYCIKYLGKGRLISVEGRLQQDRWEKDGQKRSRIVIIASSVQGLDRAKGAGEPVDNNEPEDGLPF